MAILKAFKGIRPVVNKAQLIASRPYDVLNRKEALIEAGDNKYSFLHVIKPEIDMPDSLDEHDPKVYQKGKDNFFRLLDESIMVADIDECLYIYAQTMGARTQYGIVGCASVEDYMNNVILKHELTRPDKEEDRKNHIRVSGMNYEPVFFVYPDNNELNNIVTGIVKEKPVYNFNADDGFGHKLWVIRDKVVIKRIIDIFASIPNTYVADGHHRTAAAALVGNEKKLANPHHNGTEEYNFFLAVHFPASQLSILDYNRVVKDLNGVSDNQFIGAIKKVFDIEEKGTIEYRPVGLHNFGMYLAGKWYSLTVKPDNYDDNDPIGCLDVTILSDLVLGPLLNITDLRNSKRIDFVGGIRRLGELKRRVDSGEMKVAFALYPVSIQQLFNVADSGNIMPPKTTWFEPKLRSGLVVHSLE
jgi:uncharacterized protein (DUF1015 family)